MYMYRLTFGSPKLSRFYLPALTLLLQMSVSYLHVDKYCLSRPKSDAITHFRHDRQKENGKAQQFSPSQCLNVPSNRL